ncbi:AmmeMemoRadiSam system protein B [Candidatus Falkowbacteria bacterium RIFOXYB2_FULL_34_18]|uniref:AmmeMemoRadiSam system protein B n=1 Tax=Candidatus Falkowbacteria bacterium RIFOXYD2_FULL_34_120 TaxID=1798007 RepID=A0A1F5TQ38_9BACT|nr:MAG: AmmeMemoRadiSam system protein B [Candidatus Falkowbacteria bacterium RIFOXYB2_FULL_34_18]OGF29386.1 MAG: AmmeMemoRadiSam system protein B [Candidatus Falkowbacteria bacterium RIFOXYC12_FULL_34_55]OGF36595.1 MAG: AmmeMemoRadiSam system protein B [Candidatus Falkowbacteria bacterium RIFOXYC2_FULL_34_220]OGF38813.1 MAG: AmmeMemoRadiSam system protein B [Candidatus Falkowbacteria bacterium RIFOXYD12_FULL_34_57]OGF41082.1 MAG: AmmeMemoRadiSam system protein B [Candidatus Falkowbacteria bact
MIIASSIVPHPPILIPQIGKENLSQLKTTVNAYQKLAQELEKEDIETIFIISPHGHLLENSFSINLSPKFSCNFEDFGDFSTKKEWDGNIKLTYRIKENLETKAALQLMSNENLDHGTSVPLYLLTENLPKVKIIPMYYSYLSHEDHFNFGKLLKRELLISKERVAVIASGDLSHRLTKNAPAGYSAKGKKFDNRLIDYLKNKETQKILDMDRQLIEEVGECGLRSILILLGIMFDTTYKPELFSYEAPFGVGYLVMNFKM